MLTIRCNISGWLATTLRIFRLSRLRTRVGLLIAYMRMGYLCVRVRCTKVVAMTCKLDVEGGIRIYTGLSGSMNWDVIEI